MLQAIFSSDVPSPNLSVSLSLFLLGMLCFPLLFFFFRALCRIVRCVGYAFFGGKGSARCSYEKIPLAAALAAPFAFFDFVSVAFEFGSYRAVSFANSLAMGVLAACMFLSARFAARRKYGVAGDDVPAGGDRDVEDGFFACVLGLALLFSLPQLFLDLFPLVFPAAFLLLTCIACLFLAVTGKEGRYFPAAAGCILLVLASMFVPSLELGIALRSLPVLALLFLWIPLARKARPEASGGTAVAELPRGEEYLEELETLEDHEGREVLEELELAEEGHTPLPQVGRRTERETVAEIRMNAFIPREFLRLLKRKSVTDLRLGDHVVKEMTVFFSDIRQFTEMFEYLSQEEGFAFINSYLTRVVPVIEQYGGFVDKYIGDAIMALFPQEGGADMAVRAAIEIQKRFKEYNRHREKSGYCPLNIGVGIHTGVLTLGVVGTHRRMQGTVISDSVNLASRVEELTKTFGVAIAISGQTFLKLEHPEEYMFRYLGNVRVRGKGDPTRVYEILNGTDEEAMELKIQANRNFEQGLFSFAQKKYVDALDNFSKVLEIIPDDRASLVYRKHCWERLKGA